MRDVDAGFYAALRDAPETGIVPRKLVTFTGWAWGGATRESRSFWSGDDTLDMTVTSQVDNSVSTRTFHGSVNLSVGRIVRSSQLVIQTVDIQMSANAPVVADAVRGIDLRLATVEIWDMLLNPRTRAVAGIAPAFLGVVDGSPINTEAAGGEEVVEISVVNDLMVMLTRTNPAKSSHEEQKKRLSNMGEQDDFGKYAGSVKSWKVPWGEK